MTTRQHATWIDTHAHLDDDAFADDVAAVIARAAAAGVAGIVNIGYRPLRWASTLALAERFPTVRYALGLHPGHADEFGESTLTELADRIAGSSPVAVGEIGLDFFHRDNPPPDVQRTAFREQLRLARALGLPAIIHQRAAEADLLDLVAAESSLPRLVFHSFDGGPRYAAFARDVDCFVGVGGLATRSSSASLRAVLATIPPDRILLETDAPYLVPAGARGRRNEPANVPTIGRRLSHVWDLDPEAFAALTAANAVRAFGPALAPAPPVGAATR